MIYGNTFPPEIPDKTVPDACQSTIKIPNIIIHPEVIHSNGGVRGDAVGSALQARRSRVQLSMSLAFSIGSILTAAL